MAQAPRKQKRESRREQMIGIVSTRIPRDADEEVALAKLEELCARWGGADQRWFDKQSERALKGIAREILDRRAARVINRSPAQCVDWNETRRHIAAKTGGK